MNFPSDSGSNTATSTASATRASVREGEPRPRVGKGGDEYYIVVDSRVGQAKGGKVDVSLVQK